MATREWQIRRRPGLSRLAGLWRGPDSNSGVSAVSFALVAPILLGLLLGVIDLGRAGFTQAVLFFAVQESSRWVVVNPMDVAGGELEADYEIRIENYVRSRLNLLSPAGIALVDATVSPLDPSDNTRTVDIRINYDFDWIMPYVVGGTTQFTAQSPGFLIEEV